MPRAGSASAQAKSNSDSNPRRVCAQQQIPYRSDVGQTRHGPPRPEGEAKVIASKGVNQCMNTLMQAGK